MSTFHNPVKFPSYIIYSKACIIEKKPHYRCFTRVYSCCLRCDDDVFVPCVCVRVRWRTSRWRVCWGKRVSRGQSPAPPRNLHSDIPALPWWYEPSCWGRGKRSHYHLSVHIVLATWRLCDGLISDYVVKWGVGLTQAVLLPPSCWPVWRHWTRRHTATFGAPEPRTARGPCANPHACSGSPRSLPQQTWLHTHIRKEAHFVAFSTY